MKKDFYQTLEKRKTRATSAGFCRDEQAWLGEGYYFWKHEDDAHRWALGNKRYRTNHYEIYKSEIFFDNILDTVFNEDHYYFWLKQIEKAAKVITRRTKTKPTIREVNQYFKERIPWNDVTGIQFQDLPKNPNYVLIEKFYYKKRIQLVVFNKDIICNFIFHVEGVV